MFAILTSLTKFAAEVLTISPCAMCLGNNPVLVCLIILYQRIYGDSYVHRTGTEICYEYVVHRVNCTVSCVQALTCDQNSFLLFVVCLLIESRLQAMSQWVTQKISRTMSISCWRKCCGRRIASEVEKYANRCVLSLSCTREGLNEPLLVSWWFLLWRPLLAGGRRIRPCFHGDAARMHPFYCILTDICHASPNCMRELLSFLQIFLHDAKCSTILMICKVHSPVLLYSLFIHPYKIVHFTHTKARSSLAL